MSKSRTFFLVAPKKLISQQSTLCFNLVNYWVLWSVWSIRFTHKYKRKWSFHWVTSTATCPTMSLQLSPCTHTYTSCTLSKPLTTSSLQLSNHREQSLNTHRLLLSCIEKWHTKTHTHSVHHIIHLVHLVALSTLYYIIILYYIILLLLYYINTVAVWTLTMFN